MLVVAMLDLTVKDSVTWAIRRERTRDSTQKSLASNGRIACLTSTDEDDLHKRQYACDLQEIEQRELKPELYPYGSRGPVGAHYLAAKYGVRWGDALANDI